MKKNFFKKLSFVLASAMVLTALAPASGAFAAKAPKLNASEKTLFVGETKARKEYNFNINNKKSGWKYEWASLDENVVKVNKKNGVATAVGIGTTKVAVTITDKNGELIDELEAKVIVKDNIKELTISNPVEGTLGVGKLHDFNRSFVTYGGSTKKTTAITRWEVKEEGATIEADSGKFTATVPGEYTVVARAFQSKAKYNSWLADSEKYAKYVLATAETKVKVAPSMVEAKQVDNDTVRVFFDSAMTDVDKNITLSQVVGTATVKQLIKEVKLSDDKKYADVTVYIPFTQEATYVVSYPEMDDVQFVAARMKAEDVAYIKVDTTKAVYGEATEIKVKLFNANDVDITAGEGLSSRVTLEAEEVIGTFFDGKFLTIFDKDKSVKVTATYHTYEWDTTTGEEIGNLQAVGMVVGVEKDATNITGLDAWTIVKKDGSSNYTPDFKNVKQVIAAEDQDYRLFVKFNTKTGNETDTVDSLNNQPDFAFESSNDEIMIVGEHGELYPNKQGVVTVIVKYGKDGADKTPVGAIQITVGAKAKASNLILDNTSFTLSNKIADTKDVTLKLKDQAGRDVAFTKSDVDVNIANGPDNVEFWTVASDGKTITFNGQVGSTSVKDGRYSIKITVKDIVRYITVYVVTADTTTVSKYALELGSSKVDLKVADEDVLKSVSIKLYGLASNGTKISTKTFDGENFKLVVDAPTVSGQDWDYKHDEKSNADNNTQVTLDNEAVDLFDNDEYTLVTVLNNGIIKKAPTGTYKVTAYEWKTVGSTSKWVAVDSKSFVVEDTQTLPTITKVKSLVYDSVDIDDQNDVVRVIANCFEVKLDGEELTITDAEYNGTASSIYVKTVTVDKPFDDGAGNTFTLKFKVAVGKTIKQR